MNPDQILVAEQLAAAALQPLPAGDAASRERLLDLTRQALGLGLAAQAVPVLHGLAKVYPTDPEVALVRGVALRREQRFVEAAEVFAGALAAGVESPALREGLAQTHFELGRPAAELFGEARRCSPANLALLRNHALALVAEGELDQAEAMLEEAVVANPSWLDGHRALSVIRWTAGDQARYAESYAGAAAQQPNDLDLWLAWFRALAQIRDWVGARDVLERAEQRFGNLPALTVSRLFIASESGDASETARLLNATAGVAGETIDLIRVRHALRRAEPDVAEAVCLGQLLGPAAPLFWPYLSLAWRLKDDPRAYWIDRPDRLIQPCRVDLSAAELAELAQLLRELHVMERPYVEQSVRGGTQTDRSVIQRHEPILQLAKSRWLAAIRDYVDRLPPYEQGHPLLGLPRTNLLIEGSWSVRLFRQGHNVPHNHPVGWLSTAFYISLPSPQQMGPDPAGHIAFGTPPEELGLDLQAYATIKPEVGVTAVFPSTMWHRTIPFEDGERLVLAMDIARPRY